jgi:short subunit dehydrogenase-like uncharacterized protein
MGREPTILVTGAYGLVGRELVRLLVEKTDARVIAAGRKAERLASLAADIEPGRMETQVLDVLDPSAARAACSRAGLVINGVGPYLESGEGVARAAIETETSYVDFASEQVHYQRLRGLAPSARERGLFLLTGAGLVPGLSAVLALRGAEQLPALDAVEIVYAQARMPAGDAGLGTLLTGVLEAGHSPVILRDGQQVPVRLGDDRRRMTLPEPIGTGDMIGFPSLEALTLAERLVPRSIAMYWLLAGIPPVLFTLIRLLQPHRRPWAYHLLRRLSEATLARDYERALAKGAPADALLRVSLAAGSQRWRATLRLPEGGAAPTAYLPALAARRFLEGRFEHVGLVTPVGAFPHEALLHEFAELGWKLDLEESADYAE